MLHIILGREDCRIRVRGILPLRARITKRQKTKEASLKRSQILRDLRATQAQAAEFSASARKFRCLFWRVSFAG